MNTKPKAGLNATQLATLKQRLLDTRAELTSRRAGELQARTNLVSEVEDDGDAASRANNEDTLGILNAGEFEKLAEIDLALERFETGDYGLDEDTDEPIGYGRLSIIPWARYTAENQEKHERNG
jgi:DnaK suppressor protein